MTDSASGRIARLRRRLLIEAPNATPDGMGGVTRAYAAIGVVWAKVEWLGGAERWQADRPEQAGSIRVTLRHRAGLDAGMRFRDGERIFEIRALGDPNGSGRRLVCQCEEVSP